MLKYRSQIIVVLGMFLAFLVAALTILGGISVEMEITVEPEGSGVIQGSRSYRPGQEAHLTPRPAPGFVFYGWEKQEDELNLQEQLIFRAWEKREITAHFYSLEKVRSEILNLQSVPEDGGVIEVQDYPDHPQKLQLQAQPSYPFEFADWFIEGREVSTDPVLTVHVHTLERIVARWENKLEEIDGDSFLAPVGPDTYLGDYEPADLEKIPPELPSRQEDLHLRSQALEHLKQLLDNARNQEVDLKIISAYRSYNYQEQLYQQALEEHGEETARRFNARPGQSEHQLGTTVDFGGTEHDFSWRFSETEAGEWLKKNAWRFGFIQSYPLDSEEITGFAYEPWHFRYIGVEKARELQASGQVPLEFFQELYQEEKNRVN